MESLDTRIGSAINITGKIEGEGNIVVEGRVQGNISIKGDLQIDPDGQVKSEVSARNIYIMGILVGDAVASEKIELAPGGRMIGDVRAPRVLINEGAAFRGHVDMVDFEVEERPAESHRARAEVRSTVGLRSSSPVRVGAERRREASSRSPASASVRPSGSNLYTPPPLPRSAERGGPRKAIVIKKKTTDAS